MSNPRQQWLLKVIAGPHQGAEISLHAGKTLIGSDDECDVVLHDVLVAPQHLELELGSTGIAAAPLGGRVYIQGKRIRDARQTLAFFTFLSIGGSHLVIGPVDEKWPLLSAADIPELEKEVETPEEESSKKNDTVTDDPVQESVTTPKPIVVNTVTTAASSVSKLGPILGIAAGFVLLLGWVVIYIDFFSSRSKSVDDTDRKPIDRVNAVIEELGLTGSVKVEEAAGRLTASGYVDSESRQRELQAIFRATVPGLRTKIYSLEKIASSSRALLDDQHLPLTVSSLTQGKLKVTGKLTSAEPWVRMKQTLMREVPGISAVEDEVEIETPRPQAPNTVLVPVPTIIMGRSLQSPTPAKTVTTTPAPATTTPAPAIASNSAPGITLPPPSVPSTPPLRTPDTPPQPDPVTDYLVTQDTIDTPEASISAIREAGDSLGFVRLSTGGVYFTGARLPYGGTVMKIEPNEVTIIEKGETRTLRQGDIAIKAKLITPLTIP